MRFLFRTLRTGILTFVVPLIVLWTELSVDLQSKKPPPNSVTGIIQSSANKSSDQTNPPRKKRSTGAASQTTFTPPQVNVGPQDKSIKIVPDKKVVQLGELVTFRLEPTALVARTAYIFSFDYGDGNKEKLDKSKGLVQHRFVSKGIATVSAFAEAPPGYGPDEEGIDPITITVEQVKLSAKPLSTEVGMPVSLIATSVSKDPNLRYRFSFGDDKQTGWQASNEAPHAYSAANSYVPKVEVGFEENNTDPVPADSNTVSRIDVTLPSPKSLVLHVADRVRTDETVNLSAEFPANGRQIQYRFDFGDGQTSEWQNDRSINHSYLEARNYELSAEVGVLIDGTLYPLTKSNPKSISVIASPNETTTATPDRGTTRTDQDWYPFVILVCAAVVTGLVIITVVLVGGYKVAKWAFTPKPTFVAYMDVGTASTDRSSALPLIDFELHLDPNLSAGFHTLVINGPTLVGAERSRP